MQPQVDRTRRACDWLYPGGGFAMTIQVVFGARGTVQLFGTPQAVALDVQGQHVGVDGIMRRDHGYTLLTHAEARELRDLLTAVLAGRPQRKVAA
jgi:hypothetical protein